MIMVYKYMEESKKQKSQLDLRNLLVSQVTQTFFHPVKVESVDEVTE